MTKRRWTEEEVTFLIENYTKLGSKECSIKLNRTDMSIKKKAGTLKLKDKLFWSESEEQFLYDNIDKEWSWCAEKLKRSTHAVELKAAKMGIIKKVQKYWTEEEDEYLIKNWPAGNILDITEHLQRSFDSVKSRADKVLKIVRPRNINSYGYLYIVYFPELDLFKIGITNSIDRRIRQFGYKCEILSMLKGSYREVYMMEQEMLKIISPYKVNTGKLYCGNTETYKCY